MGIIVNDEDNIVNVIKIDVPYSNLKIGCSYRLVTLIKEFRGGYLKDEKGNRLKIINAFMVSFPYGVFPVCIPSKILENKQKIILEHHLCQRLNNNWKPVATTDTSLDTSHPLQIVNVGQTLIGKNLNRIEKEYDEIQSQKDAEALRSLKIKENVNSVDLKNRDLDREIQRLKEKQIKLIEKKKSYTESVDKLSSEVERLGVSYEELKDAYNHRAEINQKWISLGQQAFKEKQEVEMFEKSIKEHKKAKIVLRNELKSEQINTIKYKNEVERRQPVIYRKVDDRTIDNLLEIQDFPSEIIGYDWKVKAHNDILANDNLPLVYVLIGKEKGKNNFLLKIGSTMDFLHRTAVYDYHEKDGHFEIGTMVFVTHLLLSNIKDPKPLELLIRYIFEQKHKGDKVHRNEWFQYSQQSINDLNTIFDYFENHLEKDSRLNRIVIKGSELGKDKRKPYFHRIAPKIDKEIERGKKNDK